MYINFLEFLNNDITLNDIITIAVLECIRIFYLSKCIINVSVHIKTGLFTFDCRTLILNVLQNFKQLLKLKCYGSPIGPFFFQLNMTFVFGIEA